MSRWTLCVLTIAVVLMGGCKNKIIDVDFNLGIETSPDLQVKVWDRHADGPVLHAFVTVDLPQGRTSTSYTDADGLTEWLLVPREAGQVFVHVSFHDERGFPHTVDQWVQLRHGGTPVTISVDTRAY